MRWWVRVLATLVLVLGGLGVAAPAQAWSYCTPQQGSDNGLNLFNVQGYCEWRMWTRWDVWPLGQCVPLTGSNDNMAAAAWNSSGRVVTLYEHPACYGVPGQVGSRWFQMAAETSHPNLYSVNGMDMGNRVSAYIVF